MVQLQMVGRSGTKLAEVLHLTMQDLIRKKMIWAGHVAKMRERKFAQNFRHKS
jgi:hypothetical protein